MEFNPPVIKHIDDILPYIKDKPEIILFDKGEYKVLDYVYCLANTFDNLYAKECRGIKFDKDGKIIGRPFHKFHNLGENTEYSTTRVDLSKPHDVLVKLDGSMIHNCIVPYVNSYGNPYSMYRLMTRKGITEVAQAAQAWLQADDDRHERYQSMWREYPSITFIYEYVGPNNKIVIDYPEENLILIAARRNYDGSYISYKDLDSLATFYNVPIVDIYSDPLESVKEDVEKEGVVVKFKTGALVKIKSEVYVRKHRSKDLICKFRDIVKLIVEDNLDDILPQLDENVKNKAIEYRDGLMFNIAFQGRYFESVVNSNSHLTQKEYALKMQKNFKGVALQLCFSVRKSLDGKSEIMRLLQKAVSDTTKLRETFEVLMLPVWELDFFKTEET